MSSWEKAAWINWRRERAGDDIEKWSDGREGDKASAEESGWGERERERASERRDERKGMNRVIMAQCESCCRKRENG